MDGAGRQERFLNVGVGVGEGKQNEGGILPVGDFEVIGCATGAQFKVAVELVLKGTIVDKGGVEELLEVKEGGDPVPRLELLFEVGPHFIGTGTGETRDRRLK